MNRPYGQQTRISKAMDYLGGVGLIFLLAYCVIGGIFTREDIDGIETMNLRYESLEAKN